MKQESSKCKPATKAELKWIEEFKKLAKRCPKNLWLFSGSGSLCVMKYPEDMNTMNESGGVNPENIIDIVEIKNDGGDW